MPRKKKYNPSNRSARKKRGATPSTCVFNQLGDDLVIDIFSRLSVKNIGTCRCVCKSWLLATSGPDFARLHLSKSSSAAGVGILMHPRGINTLYFQHILQGPGHLRRRRRGGGLPLGGGLRRSRDMQVEGMGLIDMENLKEGRRWVNTCNGLICMIDNFKKTIHVCNPILCEQIMIQGGGQSKKYKCEVLDHIINHVALGVNSRTNEYKLLQIIKYWGSSGPEFEAEIYTIGTGVWRNLGKTSRAPGRRDENFSQTPGWPAFNSSINGVVHWLCHTTGCIESFDFETEQFRSLPLPSEDFIKDICPHFGVLRGCLFLCSYDINSKHMVLWIMKDYGVQESWTKVLGFSSIPPWVSIHPIMFLRDKEILVITDYENYYHRGIKRLLCYNPAKKTVGGNAKNWDESGNRFHAVSYTPTFVSVNEISHGEEEIRVRENKKFKEHTKVSALDKEEEEIRESSNTSTASEKNSVVGADVIRDKVTTSNLVQRATMDIDMEDARVGKKIKLSLAAGPSSR